MRVGMRERESKVRRKEKWEGKRKINNEGIRCEKTWGINN